MPVTGWVPIDERAGLFALEKVVASGWCWRGLAVRLEGGEVALVSPVRGTLERSRETLDAIGRPTFALAPNHFHYMGVAEARTPELACVASETGSRSGNLVACTRNCARVRSGCFSMPQSQRWRT